MNGEIYDMKDPVKAKEKQRALTLCENISYQGTI